MVRGLFPAHEHEFVLALLEQALVALTGANVREVLTTTAWDHTAWVLANLYRESVRAPLLGPGAPRLSGLAEETRCYVTAAARTRRLTRCGRRFRPDLSYPGHIRLPTLDDTA